MKKPDKRQTGTYQLLGEQKYFIPHSLPPSPPLELTSEIISLQGEASYYLGQLNEISKRLPDAKRFVKAYVIKEALLSCAIEGIHTTLIDVFTCALDDVSKAEKNTELVLNYTKALEAALEMLQTGLPLSSRVILKTHEVLMGKQKKAVPGAYRKQSVRVGSLTPPPASEVPRLIGELEQYINEPFDLPVVIKAGLVHVQFETIHPFQDGNGRIGRLLIVLMLIEAGILDAPILYPSYYFKKYNFEYYQHLDRVRTHGDFEGWIVYYLKAIKESASDACLRAREIEALERKLKQLIQDDPLFGRTKETALATLNFLFSTPIVSVSQLSKGIDKAYNTAHNILKLFVQVGILIQEKSQKRNKLYRFKSYLELLEKKY